MTQIYEVPGKSRIETLKNRLTDNKLSMRWFWENYIGADVEYKFFLKWLNWFEEELPIMTDGIDNFMADVPAIQGSK